MIHVRAFALAAACASVAPAAAAQPGAECGPVPLPHWQQGVHLLATATADTLPAGPGAMYGQVARMERAGGPDAARLPDGAERVVLVPWGCGGDDFITRPWTESARWVQPGMRGLFWGVLRPRDQWVDGIPTLDLAEPLEQPYRIDPEEWKGEPDPPMDADQAFALLQVLPPRDAFLADPEAAIQPLLAWVRREPALAAREQAVDALGDLVLRIRSARLARVQLPVAGTYRFTVSVNGGAPRTFYARTWATPLMESNLVPEAKDYVEMLDAPAEGYVLNLDGAAVADALDTSPRDPGDPDGMIVVPAQPEPGPDGTRVWQGYVGVIVAARALPDDAALARLPEAEEQGVRRRIEADLPDENLARFVLHPDGSVTVEQTTTMYDGTVVVLRGERISGETIPSPARRLVDGDGGGGPVATRPADDER
jgi:hypothetical protein